jgi:hypothetical protein
MVANCWAIGSSSFEATKACLMRAVCATRDERLEAWLVWCVDLCFAVGFLVVACLALPDFAVPDPEVLAAGVAVDCATPDKPSISNPNRRTKLL